jgi:hypothetical protein
MKRYFGLFLGIVALLAIIVLSLVFFNSPQTSSTNVGQIPNAVAATATTTPAAPTKAAIVDGAFLTLPKELAGNDLHIRATTSKPVISQQEAMQIIYNFTKVDWTLDKNGNTWAQYGLVTLGHAGSAGKPWVGPRNVTGVNCSAGKCQNSSQVLDHIEDRPMWVLDYANADIPIPGVMPCPGCPNTPPSGTKHVVYTIDAQTKTIMGPVSFYTK